MEQIEKAREEAVNEAYDEVILQLHRDVKKNPSAIKATVYPRNDEIIAHRVSERLNENGIKTEVTKGWLGYYLNCEVVKKNVPEVIKQDNPTEITE